ncbi:MAG: hypothetical protein Harvfovirus6_44 [Harvfovirus sp.]|uniref:Uncharacterized protein n=1 Tax=Harvfovirus sp. TaxID=2487768 RepID=A0A3G5A2R4_9VIRU|nr:MAG: hypothetical protein Harvfovirus6_44 [Harvfovirus sp.]
MLRRLGCVKGSFVFIPGCKGVAIGRRIHHRAATVRQVKKQMEPVNKFIRSLESIKHIVKQPGKKVPDRYDHYDSFDGETRLQINKKNQKELLQISKKINELIEQVHQAIVTLSKILQFLRLLSLFTAGMIQLTHQALVVLGKLFVILHRLSIATTKKLERFRR